MISTFMPARVAATASAAVTVVFPTPPLPATIITREAEHKRSRSMLHDATGVLIARRLRRSSRSPRSRSRVCIAIGDAYVATRVRRRRLRRAAVGSTSCRSRATSTRRTKSLVRDSIADANKRGSTLLVLQLKSSGAIDAGVDDIVRAIDQSDVPVAVWVGPSGADAKGATTVLLEAAHLAYIAPALGRGCGAAAAARRSGRQHPRRRRRPARGARPEARPQSRRGPEARR